MAKGIIYLEKASLDYYAEKMPEIPKLVFTPDVIQDIEVIDIAKLDQAIKNFITTNKLVPAALTIVLGNSVIFAKDIAKLDPKQVVKDKAAQPPAGQIPSPLPPVESEDLAEQFLEAVPFNEVSSITLPIPNGVKVIAANKDMYTDIRRSFEKYSFTVDAVAPLLAFGASVEPVDGTIARRLLDKVDMAKQHNLLNIHPVVATKTSSQTKPGEKKPNIRLVAMIGVLVVLFGVMGVMLYTTFFAPAPAPKPAPALVFSPTPVVTAAPVVTDEVSSNSAVLSDFSVQIIEPTTGSSEAAQLKSVLTKLGMKDITVKKGTTVTTKTVVAQSTSLDAAVKEKIGAAVQTLFPTASVIETEDQEIDIIITLGQTEK